jgi:hypothetical protein
MAIRISGSPGAVPGDRRIARAILDLLPGELSRIRTAALAWRNGIGALLAGLMGFGLIKGRSDVGQLAAPYDAVTGLLLLTSLICGATAAALLLRAAHGRPASVAIRAVIDSSGTRPELRGRLGEVDASAKALAWGVAASFTCVAFLAAAVGLTWYGPPREGPRLQIRKGDGGLRCGEVVQLASGILTLKTPQGQTALDLRHADGIEAVDTCPKSPTS